MDYIAHKSISNEEQSVEQHLTNVANICAKYCANFGCESIGAILGYAHDLGKFSDEFQARLNGGEVCDHSTFGGQVIFDMQWTQKELKVLKEMLGFIVFSHHGGLFDCINNQGKNSLLERRDKELLEKSVIQDRSKKIINEINTIPQDKLLEEFTKIKNTVHCGSKKQSYFIFSLITKVFFSALVDADRVDTISFCKGLKKSKFVSWDKIADAVDQYVSKFPETRLSKIRNEIYTQVVKASEGERGIYTLEVQTGGGKTLSALRFGVSHAKKNNLDRIIIVLPYLSIIEQNVEVIKNVLKDAQIDQDIVLESHSNISYDEEVDSYYLTDNFDSQIVVTTMVQFLESVFSGGASAIRRFHNYGKSLIIFDEIQLLPSCATALSLDLFKVLTQILGSSILFCSATQPSYDDANIFGQYALPKNQTIFNKKFNELDRVDIVDNTRNIEYDEIEIAQMVEEQLKTSNSVLIVLNTKKTAVVLFNQLKDMLKSVNIYYLTTSLCGAHRSDVIKCVKNDLKNNKKTVLVSTQLIEAGVDIDFAVVYRDVAGLDSIIQSAGRCNREGKLTNSQGQYCNGICHVVNIKSNLTRLKEIKQARDVTIRILHEAKKEGFRLTSKTAIDRYYRYHLYNQVKDKLILFPTDNSYVYDLYSTNDYSVEENITRFSQLQTTMRQAFQRAGESFNIIDDDSISVVVPYGDGVNIIKKLKEGVVWDCYSQCQRYVVNVRSQIVNKYQIARTTNKIYYLDCLSYSNMLGLVESDFDYIV